MASYEEKRGLHWVIGAGFIVLAITAGAATGAFGSVEAGVSVDEGPQTPRHFARESRASRVSSRGTNHVSESDEANDSYPYSRA